MIRIRDNGLVYYQFENLAAHKGLTHAVFTRLGGVSLPPYDSLNVASVVGDDPEAVQTNRERIYAALNLPPERVVTGYQVHGTRVAAVGASLGGHLLPATDGLITNEPVALFLRFADCVPILLFDPVTRATGALHAGWRGTAAGMAAEGVRHMRQQFGSRPEDLIACIGPSIGPCCYQVGADFVEAMSAAWPGAQPFIQNTPDGPHADLWGMNRQQLLDAGVRQIEVAHLCTACHTDEFFSHRGNGGRTGRFGVILQPTKETTKTRRH